MGGLGSFGKESKFGMETSAVPFASDNFELTKINKVDGKNGVSGGFKVER